MGVLQLVEGVPDEAGREGKGLDELMPENGDQDGDAAPAGLDAQRQPSDERVHAEEQSQHLHGRRRKLRRKARAQAQALA